MMTMMIIMTVISRDFLPGLMYAECFVCIMPNCSFVSSFDKCLPSSDSVPGSGYAHGAYILEGKTDGQQKGANYLVG